MKSKIWGFGKQLSRKKRPSEDGQNAKELAQEAW